ncbi:MAG: TOBE domain-containing protein [Pseudomonadota bacterium]
MLYATLKDGTDLAVRGANRTGTFADLPKSGERVRLGLDPGDTVIIAGEA